MTDAEWETYVRSLLNEGEASFWTAEDMAAYKQVALIAVSSAFWNLLAPLKRRTYVYSLAVGENYLSLPVGWHKVIRIEIAATGQPLKWIPDREYPDYLAADSDEPVGAIFMRGKIQILPPMTSAKTDYLRLFYLPRPESLEDLPEDLHPLAAVEAALAARTKDENVSAYLVNLRDRYEWVARKALSAYQSQAPLSIENEFEIEVD